MDLALTTDQKSFASTTRAFVDKSLPLAGVRERTEEEHPFDPQWWGRGAELGWAAMLVPEELGGGNISGSGVKDLALIAEELGKSVSPAPIVPVNVVVSALVDSVAQDGADHSETLEGLLAGELVGSWAVYEPGREWDPTSPATTARRSGDGWTLNGVKDRVEAGAQADVLLVTAATDEGLTQFLVPTDTAGVTVTPTWSLDLARQFAVVELEDVALGTDAVVGRVGEAASEVEYLADLATVLQLAETMGGLDTAFDFTVAWAFDRFSFGRPLASYQALKHRFADMKTWIEASHATTQAAIDAVQRREADRAELVSTAAQYVGAKALVILQDCVQMHGGIGVTWEHDLHFFIRRATVNQTMYGTPSDHRRRIADLIKL